MRDRLIELSKKAHSEWLKKQYDHETDKDIGEYVADYLIENGVIVPPVKVGAKVYIIGWCDDIEEFVVRHFLYETNGTGAYVFMFRAFIGEESWFQFWEHDLGKTVFLAREQAEQALAEMQK